MQSFGREPGFALVVVLTLALGIGANVAIFTAIDAVLLRPLPYADQDRLVELTQLDLRRTSPRDPVSPANFLDWRERVGRAFVVAQLAMAIIALFACALPAYRAAHLDPLKVLRSEQ